MSVDIPSAGNRLDEDLHGQATNKTFANSEHATVLGNGDAEESRPPGLSRHFDQGTVKPAKRRSLAPASPQGFEEPDGALSVHGRAWDIEKGTPSGVNFEEESFFQDDDGDWESGKGPYRGGMQSGVPGSTGANSEKKQQLQALKIVQLFNILLKQHKRQAVEQAGSSGARINPSSLAVSYEELLKKVSQQDTKVSCGPSKRRY